jgi:hypothetical protein
LFLSAVGVAVVVDTLMQVQVQVRAVNLSHLLNLFHQAHLTLLSVTPEAEEQMVSPGITAKRQQDSVIRLPVDRAEDRVGSEIHEMAKVGLRVVLRVGPVVLQEAKVVQTVADGMTEQRFLIRLSATVPAEQM